MVFFFPFKERTFPFFPMTSRLRTRTPIRRSRTPEKIQETFVLLAPGLPAEHGTPCGILIHYEHVYVPWPGWLQKLNAGRRVLWCFLVWKASVSSAASRSSGQVTSCEVTSPVSSAAITLLHIHTKRKGKEERSKMEEERQGRTGASVLMINS